MTHQELLTTPEVATMLGKSSRTVHRAVEAGELKPAKKLPGPNGAYLFDSAEVEVYRGQLAEPKAVA